MLYNTESYIFFSDNWKFVAQNYTSIMGNCLFVLCRERRNMTVDALKLFLRINPPYVTDKLYHIMLHRVHIAWVRFELTTSVVIDTDCIGSYISNYHTITITMAPQFLLQWSIIVICRFMFVQIKRFYMFHIENWVNITWATADLLICTNMNLHITMMLHCKRNWGAIVIVIVW
jgi:hypothetical protein